VARSPKGSSSRAILRSFDNNGERVTFVMQLGGVAAAIAPMIPNSH